MVGVISQKLNYREVLMSYIEQMQSLWHEFEEVHGQEPTTTRECFEWAYKNKRWAPRATDMAQIFNKEMTDALRQEYRIDASGRKYRAKVCIKEKIGPVQRRCGEILIGLHHNSLKDQSISAEMAYHMFVIS